MKRRCPVCNKTVEESNQGQSEFSPFCSQRCRMVDLGAWLEGEYRIPVTPETEEFEENPDTAIPPPDES